MSGTQTNLSIQTNANNDIFLDGSGNLAMATGVLAVQQDCEHALKAQLGEMFLQPLDGMPTLADVWQSRNFIKWEAAARSTLAAINGVVSISSFAITTTGDTFNYTTNILTAYSPSLITVSGALDKPA